VSEVPGLGRGLNVLLEGRTFHEIVKAGLDQFTGTGQLRGILFLGIVLLKQPKDTGNPNTVQVDKRLLVHQLLIDHEVQYVIFPE
jgi:hypothetical protein